MNVNYEAIYEAMLRSDLRYITAVTSDMFMMLSMTYVHYSIGSCRLILYELYNLGC